MRFISRYLQALARRVCSWVVVPAWEEAEEESEDEEEEERERLLVAAAGTPRERDGCMACPFGGVGWVGGWRRKRRG